MEKEPRWLDEAREDARKFDDEVVVKAKRFDKRLQVNNDGEDEA